MVGKYRRLRGDRCGRSAGLVQVCVLYLQFTYHVMRDVLVRERCVQVTSHESRIATPKRP